MSCDKTKLEYLRETKRLMREKIDPRGNKITDETPFREYVNYMGDIKPANATVSLLSSITEDMHVMGNATEEVI